MKAHSKRKANKDQKRDRLMKAGYALFTEKDLHQCTIGEIAKKADVAKGTFYLYFPDKYHMLNALILEKSSEILEQAIQASIHLPGGTLPDRGVFLVGYVIDYLKAHRTLLKLIDKNLSWGLFREAVEAEPQYASIRALRDQIIDDFYANGFERSHAEKLLFMVIELTSSVCYSSMILHQPDDIEQMKPALLDAIRRILSR